MYNRISLEVCAAAVAVLDEGSFAQAALRLGISLSLLEMQIVSLEQQLEMRLFDADHEQVRVTSDGHVFVNACRASVSEMDQSAFSNPYATSASSSISAK